MDKLLGKLLSQLPFKKLTANQTFDLCCGFMMLALIFFVFAAGVDLGPHAALLKPLLIAAAIGLIFWSLASNRE